MLRYSFSVSQEIRKHLASSTHHKNKKVVVYDLCERRLKGTLEASRSAENVIPKLKGTKDLSKECVVGVLRQYYVRLVCVVCLQGDVFALALYNSATP